MRNSNIILAALVAAALYVVFSSLAQAEQVGSVNSSFNILGSSDQIVVEVFDDPDIPGVACYLSRAKTGGVAGALGIAEDTSDASLSCRQISSRIEVSDKVKKENGKSIFSKSTSILFKKMQVVRFYDTKRKVLIYLTYSDKLIDGSPKNSISVVPVNFDR